MSKNKVPRFGSYKAFKAGKKQNKKDGLFNINRRRGK
jgi:hypothetical protein